MSRIIFSTIAIALVTSPLVAGQAETIRFARHFGDYLKGDGPKRTGELGMLVLHTHWMEMRRNTQVESPERFELTLSPSNGGDDVHVFQVRQNTPELIKLPAGRYCITGLSSAVEVTLPCEVPFFDVSAHSISISGNVDIHVRGGKARIAWRDFSGTWDKLNLAEAQQVAASEFLEQASRLGYQTYFSSRPLAQPKILRVSPTGVAEYEELALASSSYMSGTWVAQGGGTGQAEFRRGNLAMQVSGDPPHFRMSNTSWRSYDRRTQKFASQQKWSASSRIECWHWSACGQRFATGMFLTPEFDAGRFRVKFNGRIEIAFNLSKKDDVFKPTRIEVKQSSLPEWVSEKIAKLFGDARFNFTLKQAQGRRRQTIEFRSKGDRIYTEYGALEIAHEQK